MRTSLDEAHNDPMRDAWRIVVFYVLLCGLWLLLSDAVIQWAFANPERRIQAESLKDWLFVALSAMLLYALVRQLLQHR